MSRLRVTKKAPAADGWAPRFRPDGRGAEHFVFERVVAGKREEIPIQPWQGLADCAHFLSRALSAGGAKTDERGVGSLVATLRKRADTWTICEKIDKKFGQRVIDAGLLKPGDMIGYFNISGDPHSDYGGAARYTHSTMFCGKTGAAGDPGHVTCHTKSRFMGLTPPDYTDVWWLSDDYSYTFIHFTAGDASIAAHAAKMKGWWTVVYGAKVRYYYVRGDGRAFYTKIKPSNASKVLTRGSSEDVLYWFNTAPTLTFVRRSSGSVEVWTPVYGTDQTFNFSINDNPGIAVRTKF